MRFRIRSSIMLIAATFVLYLGIKGQLDLYIHPRYIVFTLVLSAIALFVTLVHEFYLANNKTKAHDNATATIALIPLFFLLGAAVVLPARTLSSATVSQRAPGSGSIVTTSQARPINSLFAGSSRGLSMVDWSRLLAAIDDPSYYINKPAKISGFVYDAGLGSNTVWLARFVVTCCAVDAQPIGIPVQLENWQLEYQEDEWAEVEGVFMSQPTANGEQLVLIPESVQRIEEPDDPYAN